MKMLAGVILLSALLAIDASAQDVVSPSPPDSRMPEVEALVEILEHYLLLGEAPAGSEIEARAKRVRERWQRVQREGLVEPINGYLSGLPNDEPHAVVGMGLRDHFARYDGAFVTEVLPNSPAETVGLRAGDIIVGWNGEAIDLTSPSRDLVMRMNEVAPNNAIRLSVLRDGKKQEFTVNPIAGAAFTKRRFEIPPPRSRCVTIVSEPWIADASDAEILRSRRPISSLHLDCQGAYRHD